MEEWMDGSLGSEMVVLYGRDFPRRIYAKYSVFWKLKVGHFHVITHDCFIFSVWINNLNSLYFFWQF